MTSPIHLTVVPLVPPGGHPPDVQCPGGADNRPRRAVCSSASAASSSATTSETVVSVSVPKASTPWPLSRTARVSGRSPISSMTALAEGATGTSSAWPRRGSGSYGTGNGRPATANASRCGECVWITAPAWGLTRYISVCMATTSVLIPPGSPRSPFHRGGSRPGHRARGRGSGPAWRSAQRPARPGPRGQRARNETAPGAHQAHRDIHHGAAERKV